MGEFLFNIGIFLFLIGLGLIAGSRAEKKHYRRLAAAEADLQGIRVSSLRSLPGCLPNSPAHLVTGEVTIASDYFKTFVSGLRNLFGGEVKSLQRLTERARREAMVRMLFAARSAGCNAVGNVRFDSSDIAGNAQLRGKSPTPMATVMASGTAYRV
jgi:uncharacterized protein YbjQ (UPF0145 family)